MKNLLLSRFQSFTDNRLNNSSKFCVNNDLGTVYFVTGEGLVSFAQESFKTIVPKSKFDEYIPSAIVDEVISISYLPYDQAVVLILKCGLAFMIRIIEEDVTFDAEDCFEVIKCLDEERGSILACCWSPDQESCVICTDDSIILINQDLKILWDIQVIASEYKDNKLVSVGWGTKETQFHGSEGKSAAKVASKKPVSLLPSDDGLPSLSWRGDGELFVVSSVVKDIGYRQLRVFDKHGQLISTSEDVIGLENNLNWKPSGSLIAASQQHQNKHRVIFYEKNGLQHGEFIVPYKPGEVFIRNLMWNIDSTILSVWYEHPAESNTNKSWIELWTVKNYHWYLKQTLPFDELIKDVIWDAEVPCSMHILTSSSTYNQYKFRWGINKSDWLSPSNNGIVAVIDGDKVLVSAFKHLVIPPPMASEVINLNTSVNEIIFEPSSDNICLVTSDGNLFFYKFCESTHNTEPKSGFKKPINFSYNLLATVENPNRDISIPGLWVWISESSLIFTYHLKRTSYIRNFQLCRDNSMTLTQKSEKALEDVVEMVRPLSHSSHAVMQLVDGRILKYDVKSDVVEPFGDKNGSEVKFLTTCDVFDSVHFKDDDYVFGLNSNFYFFMNNICLAKDCTSFLLNDEFLLFTTHQHLLRCVPLSDLNKDDIANHVLAFNTREIERGAHLINGIPCDTKVILQMPRGNLETIHPRSLVLNVIGHNLDLIFYKKAFEMMRRHRVNLNLAYDHNPDLFMTHVKDFIIQLNNPTSLSLFVSDLEAKDFRSTMYKSYCIYGADVTSPSSSDDFKVDGICDAMRKEMEKLDYQKYLLPILTCHIKKKNPEIEEALFKIQVLSKSGQTNLFSECLRHLLYIVDVNQLYDHALGMYDFGIVLMVADKSQKDPKEYLPFLNELQKMEENYMKFKIDCHLKRHKKALVHLSRCDKINEFLAYMENNELYNYALTLFPTSSENYTKVSELYANWLKNKRLYEEAGIWYSKCGKMTEAVDCFSSAQNWRLAYAYMAKSDVNKTDFVKYSNELVNGLKNIRNYLDAAFILEHYLKNVEESVVLLTEGHEWEEVLRICHEHKRADLIETNLIPNILEYVSATQSNLEQMKTNFDQYQTRLSVVRGEKKRKAEDPDYDDGYEHNDADADLYSDISSIRSQISRSTGRSQRSRMSSKSRKKMEKKRYSLKEGSQYEEEALVIAISEIMHQIYDMKQAVRKTTVVLCLMNKDKNAMNLQTKFDEIVAYFKNQSPQVWPLAKKQDEVFGAASTVNSIVGSMNQQNNNSDIDPEMMRQMLPPKEVYFKWNLDF